MIKLKKVSKPEEIRAGDYIAVEDTFELITEVSVDTIDDESVAYIYYGKGKKVVLDWVSLMDIQFGVLEEETDEIGMEIVFRCKHCHNPSVVFDSKEQAQHHADRCLFNPGAQKCVMCKHLKIIEEPPYPRYQKMYQSSETYHAFGAFKQPYCMLKEENITEYNLFDDHSDCFEFSDEPPVTEQTPEMEQYLELINSDIEQQEVYIKEEALEKLKGE